jgi:hypothetical protein
MVADGRDDDISLCLHAATTLVVVHVPMHACVHIML